MDFLIINVLSSIYFTIIRVLQDLRVLRSSCSSTFVTFTIGLQCNPPLLIRHSSSLISPAFLRISPNYWPLISVWQQFKSESQLHDAIIRSCLWSLTVHYFLSFHLILITTERLEFRFYGLVDSFDEIND